MINGKPLSGIRVVDFSVVWAGPFCTMMLADLGAEVIKPENPYVLQPLTRILRRHLTQDMIDAALPWIGGFPHNTPGPRPWNYWPNSTALYRNKKSFTVDWRQPEGLDVLRQLIAKADVVCDNNANDILARMGITYEWMKEANPEIIYLRMPAFGLNGPYAGARALAVHLEAVTGHSLLRGYEDLYPGSNTGIYPADHMSGAHAAFAVMAALWNRRQTGESQLVEVPQVEAALPLVAQAIVDYSLNAKTHSAIGNRDFHGKAPCGVYPTRTEESANDMDRWIAIHITTDEEWAILRQAMGEPEWAMRSDLETNTLRLAHSKEIDARLAEWTIQHDDYDLTHTLQSAGIIAMPVLEASRVFDDPHLQARGFIRRQRIENGESYNFMGPLWNYTKTPVDFWQGPVGMGEFNDYVYRELLGMDGDEYKRFTELGHVTMDLDEHIE